MEAYPRPFVDHNLPLVLLSGLGVDSSVDESSSLLLRHGGGTKVQLKSPECSGNRAASLLRQFQQVDGSGLAWNVSSLPGPTGIMRCRMRAIGRNYTLPPRKAAPLPQSPTTEGVPNLNAQSKSELHSPLSPSSPGSPVFPDGLMTPFWFAKHQFQVPALFLAFFDISASGTPESDEQIKSDINALRAALNRSGFKPRLAAVLLSDKSILSTPQLEDRLSSIRKVTALDSKTGLFFMPPMSSQGEIATFVHSIMVALQPSCLEYYRDLTKHARRKKAKAGSASPSVPGFDIKALSPHGWYVRYEVKQGVFAEFRQEMEIAERHYSTAIDDIFHAEGVFETTTADSPRWNEARLLCDTLTLRVVRCQLWTAQTTAAVQSWMNYKSRVKALIERKGKGTDTYSWAAWESRWAEIMAQLVQRANLLPFQPSQPKSDDAEEETAMHQIYLRPEKSFAAVERTPPVQTLHHPGYWLRMAAKHFRSRLQKALAIPEADKRPSDQSPASSIAVRHADYDLYLVPPPDKEYRYAHEVDGTEGEAHGYNNLLNISQRSIEQFLRRNQTRLSDSVTLDLAQDLMRYGKYAEASQLLRPLWDGTTWRTEKWHAIFTDLLLAMRTCAEHVQDHELLLSIMYELISVPTVKVQESTSSQDDAKDWNWAPPTAGDTISLSFADHQRLCPVAMSFAFKEGEKHVGDALDCQLVLSSVRESLPSDLSVHSIVLQFDNGRSVTFVHSDEPSLGDRELSVLSPAEGGTTTDLTFHTHLSLRSRQSKIFQFKLLFREASVVQLEKTSICLRGQSFSIQHTFTEDAARKADTFYTLNQENSVEKLSLSHKDTTSVHVLPKPPKIVLAAREPRKTYYVGETVRMSITLANEEVDGIEGNVSVVSTSSGEDSQRLVWTFDEAGISRPNDTPQSATMEAVSTIQIAEAKSREVLLLARATDEPTTAEVQITIDYCLTSDRSTQLRKSMTISIAVVMPFDARFNFGPLLYQGEWPSYFAPGSDHEQGIPQLWRLGCQIQSTATEDLVVREIKPIIDDVIGDSAASASGSHFEEGKLFPPGKTERYSLELKTTKHSLDDRRPTTVDCSVALTWSRKESKERAITYLAIPRLTLPVSEPRVLCTIVKSDPDDEWDGVLQYHIENPSTHFLTFAISMEATDQFAFSGPKSRAVSLAPLSRYKVEYHIALQEMGEGRSTEDEGCWVWPALQVTDSYYQKTLRVHPGGPGVRVDDKQNIGVLINRPQK